MSESMIERVAKAMRAESGGKPFLWENAARAAIEAMRAPTENMERMGSRANKFENKQPNGEFGCPGVTCNVDPPDDWTDPKNVDAIQAYLNAPKCMIALVKLPPLNVWEAMIDAALAEKE